MIFSNDPVGVALAALVGDDQAEAFLKKMLRYTNYPNLVTGIAKMPSDPKLEQAALKVVEDPELEGPLGLIAYDADIPTAQANPSQVRHMLFGATIGGPIPTDFFWGLLTLAARADVGVIDRLDDAVTNPAYATRLVAKIRRAVKKHAAALASDAPPPPDVPQRVSEVKEWLAGHPDADPELLAPTPKQKTAARIAAMRALGSLATPQSLAVLKQYAKDRYSEAEQKELSTAWDNFDRREFAAAMFGPSASRLDLGMVSSIEGIEAVPNLAGLSVGFLGDADLSPLASCKELRRLGLSAQGNILSLEPLSELSELRVLTLRGNLADIDLSPLAELAVRELEVDGNLQGTDLSPLARMAVRDVKLIGIPAGVDLSALSGLGASTLQIELAGVNPAFLTQLPNLWGLRLSAGQEFTDEDGTFRQTVFSLVRSGVLVAVYRFERNWTEQLVEAANNESDIFVVEKSGFYGFTNDESKVAKFERSLSFGSVP